MYGGICIWLMLLVFVNWKEYQPFKKNLKQDDFIWVEVSFVDVFGVGGMLECLCAEVYSIEED